MEITIENISNFSPLEVINYVEKKLIAQNTKSVNKRKQSVYRGLNNTKCALGFLIPDHLYKKEIEGYHIYFMLNENNIYLDNQIRILLSKLQIIHDRYDIDNWIEKFEELKKEYSS